MNTVSFVAAYITYVPLLVGILKYRRNDETQKVLTWLICLASATQIIQSILTAYKINNLFLCHIYPVIEIIFFLIIYRKNLGNLYPIYFVPLICSLTIILSLVNSLFFQSIVTFNSNGFVLVSAVLIFFSISYFYKLLKAPLIEHLENSPMFWINNGVIIYFSGALVIFSASNYILSKSVEIQRILWGFHGVFNIVMYCFFTISLWVNLKK